MLSDSIGYLGDLAHIVMNELRQGAQAEALRRVNEALRAQNRCELSGRLSTIHEINKQISALKVFKLQMDYELECAAGAGDKQQVEQIQSGMDKLFQKRISELKAKSRQLSLGDY